MKIVIFKPTELLKANYTKRTGSPGNYKYYYGDKKKVRRAVKAQPSDRKVKEIASYHLNEFYDFLENFDPTRNKQLVWELINEHGMHNAKRIFRSMYDQVSKTTPVEHFEFEYPYKQIIGQFDNIVNDWKMGQKHGD